MFDEQDRKYFYDEFKNNGYEVGSYEDFKKDLNNKEDRDWYYNEAKSMGYDVGTQADFDKMVLEPSPSAPAPAPTTAKQETPAVAKAEVETAPVAQKPQEQLQTQQPTAKQPAAEPKAEKEQPSLISQALGMMPKVDAEDVDNEQKMVNRIANISFGNKAQQAQQPTQQPVQQPTPKAVDAVTGETPTQQVDAIYNKYVGNGDALSETMYDLMANGQAQNQEEAQQMAMGAMNRAASNLAQRTTDDFVSKLGDSVKGIEEAISNGWYSHGVQDKLKNMAAQLGIQNSVALDENGNYITQTDGYDQFINGMVKPAMVESLVKKYGENYRPIATDLATRLYSHDDHVQGEMMNRDINTALSEVINKYTNSSVVKAVQDAEQAANAQMGKYNEQSKYTDAASPFAIGAIAEANKARDPQKILGDLKKKFGKLYQNEDFLNDMSLAAFKVMADYGVQGGLSGDPKQFKPMINAALKSQLDQLEVQGKIPRGSAEYILKTGLGNTIIGKVSRKMMQTDYQNWLEDIANQQYQPGFWDNVASGALTFAGDAWSYWLPGAAGTKLTKSMIAKAEGKLATDLWARGMERKMAERAAKVLVGKSKGMALKSGAAHGAVTFGGQSAISKPIDEKYRTGQFDENGKVYDPSLLKVLGSTVGEVAKQSAVGAIMQGGTIANMVGKGRGLATNILADVGGKVADSSIMTGQQMLERMSQDPNFKPTGKDAAESFLESMANLTAIGLPGMMGKYARFKDAREFNRKYEFSDEDMTDLRRLGYADLRDAFEQMGIHGNYASGEGVQMMGQLTDKYMNLMNDKSVPEVLKAKMMAVVEGKRPSSFSPVIDSVIVQPMDNGGKVYLETLNKDGGIIDRKEYSSVDEAQKAEKKLDYEKSLNITSEYENAYHTDALQERMETVYQQARDKYAVGDRLTDEDKAAIYLHQNAAAIKDIMQKQQSGMELTEQEQKLVNAYRSFYDSAFENSPIMKEYVRTFEDSQGVEHGTLRKALEGDGKSRTAEQQKLVEAYQKQLYNDIVLKREMKQTVDDLYNTSKGRDQKRIEQSGMEGEAPAEAAVEPSPEPSPEQPSSVSTPYQGRTNSVPSPRNAESSAESANSANSPAESGEEAWIPGVINEEGVEVVAPKKVKSVEASKQKASEGIGKLEGTIAGEGTTKKGAHWEDKVTKTTSGDVTTYTVERFKEGKQVGGAAESYVPIPEGLHVTEAFAEDWKDAGSVLLGVHSLKVNEKTGTISGEVIVEVTDDNGEKSKLPQTVNFSYDNDTIDGLEVGDKVKLKGDNTYYPESEVNDVVILGIAADGNVYYEYKDNNGNGHAAFTSAERFRNRLVLEEAPTEEPNVATSAPNVAASEPNVATSEGNVATSPSNVATSDAFLMGQNAYKNGDAEGLKAIDRNDDVSKARLKRAFADDEAKMNAVVKAYEEGKDMGQYLDQHKGYMTPAQQEAARKYVEAQDAKKGVLDALQHSDDGYAEALKEQLWDYQTEDGNIVPVVMKNGMNAFLKKANEYGGGFLVKADENGKPKIWRTTTNDIKEMGTPVPFDEYINQMVEEQKNARKKQFYAQFDGSSLQPGSKVEVAMEAGDEPMEMTFAGYGEDGKIVLSDGKEYIDITKSEFNTWRQNALAASIGAELDAEDTQRAEAEAAKAEAEKQERYKKAIFGYAAGQPDYSDPQTDPKVAAGYLQETSGSNRKSLFGNIAAEKKGLQTRINQLREHIAHNEEWLSVNADLDPKNAETRTLANKQMEGQIADLQTRFDNWNKIRSYVMTPEEAAAIKADRTKKIADAGVSEGEITPIADHEFNLLTDEELKEQFPTMDEASKFIADQRKHIYKLQSEKLQREIDGVDKVLNRYTDGEIDLEPEQIKELNTAKAQLMAAQQVFTDTAKKLKAQADNLNKLYRKENMAARGKAFEAMTPAEQRAVKAEAAIKSGNLSQLNTIYEDVRGVMDFTDTEPDTLEEYVASRIGRFSINYEGKEKGGAFSNGIKQETGLGRDDFKNLQILAKEGEGKTVPEFVHGLYNDMPEHLRQLGYTDHDIRSAFLNLIGSIEKYSDLKNYVVSKRVADAEQKMRALEQEEANMYGEGEEQKKDFKNIAPIYDFENDPNHDESERKSMVYQEGETIDDYAKRTSPFLMEEHQRQAYIQQKYADKLDEIDAILGQPMNTEEDGEKVAKQLIKIIDPEQKMKKLDVFKDLDTMLYLRNTPPKSAAALGYEFVMDKKGSTPPSGGDFSSRLKAAIAETETNPTDAQKKAGNYKKGHLQFGGYDFTVETPKGVTRSGVDENGKPWSVTMHDTYGYIKGKIGVDGDHIDMFINDDADLDNFDGNVMVIDQVNPETGEFDEHKVMYGYPDVYAAKTAYLNNYSAGWRGLGKITSVSKGLFDKWLESSNRKTKPFRDYAIVQEEQRIDAMAQLRLKPLNDAIAKTRPQTDALKEAVESGDKKAVAKAQKALAQAILDNKLGHKYLDGQVGQCKMAKKADKSYQFKRALIKPCTDAMKTMEDALDSALQEVGLDGVHVDFSRGDGWVYADKGSAWSNRLEALDNNYRWVSQEDYNNPVYDVPQLTLDNADKVADYIKSQIEEGEAYNKQMEGDDDTDIEETPADDKGNEQSNRVRYNPDTKEWAGIPEEVITDDKPNRFGIIDGFTKDPRINVYYNTKSRNTYLRVHTFDRQAETPERINAVLEKEGYNVGHDGESAGFVKFGNYADAVKFAQHVNEVEEQVHAPRAETPKVENLPFRAPMSTDELPFHREVEEVKPSEMTEMQRVAYKAVSTMLRKAGIPVRVVSNETMERVAEEQDNRAITMLMSDPRLRFNIKTPEQKRAAHAAYDWAAKHRPGKMEQYAIVNMSNPNQMPEYFQKKALADRARKYYSNEWKVGNYKLFDLNKPFEEQVGSVVGKVPSEFDPYKQERKASKMAELQRQKDELVKQREELSTQLYEYNYKRNKAFFEALMDYRAQHPGETVPDSFIAEATDKSIGSHDPRPELQRQIDEVDGKINAISKQMVADGGVRFLRTYHGSGADFTEFDFDHMGEGEGSQAFGWGGYVTSSKKIGKFYATLMDKDPSSHQYLTKGNADRILKKYPTLESFLSDPKVDSKVKHTKEEKIAYYNNVLKDAEPYHNFYEVNIPDDTGSNYLDWDNSLSDEQQKMVYEALFDLPKEKLDQMAKDDAWFRDNLYYTILNVDKDRAIPVLVSDHTLTKTTSLDEYEHPDDGSTVYRRLKSWLGSDKDASQLLAKAGFTGIKYPAGTIHGGAEEGDTNYVIFKPEDMQIADHTKFAKAKGTVYGYTDGKEIVLNQDHLNVNTPIHEYQHIWRTAAKAKNPDLIAHGDKLIKETEWFKNLQSDPNYKHLSEEQLCDEAFARLTGDEGEEILRQMAEDAIKENPLDTAKELSVINRLKNWLKKFWYWTLETFTKWKPEDIKRMTLEDIRNLVLRDLANGVDPRKVMEEKKAEDIMFMGSTTKKRMKDIASQLQGRELTKEQQAVADVFSGLKDNVPLTVERKDGEKKIIMRQGNDNHAGTKHSVFRHYGVKANSVNVDDLMLIPTVLKEGERKVSDNGRIAYVYTEPKSQTRYTVVTDPKNNKEIFNDFYSNKKANPSETSSEAMDFTNTPEGAHNNDENALMGAKVGNSSETAKGNTEKVDGDGPKTLLTVDGKPAVVREDNGTVELNYNTWQKEKEQVRDALTIDAGLDEDEADAILANADAIAEGMKDLMKKYPRFRDFQYQEAGNRPVIRDNGDYLSWDYSFNCIKKDAVNAVMDKLVSMGKSGHLGVTQVEAIKKILQKHKFLTPCVMCYVEGKRKVLKQSKMDEQKWNAVREAAGLDDKLMGEPTELTKEQENALAELSEGKGLDRVSGYTSDKQGDGIKAFDIQKIASLMLGSDILRGNMNYEWMMSPSAFTDMYNKFGNTGLMKYLTAGQYRGKQLLEAVPFSINGIPRDIYLKMYSQVELKERGGLRQFSYEDARAMMFFDYYTQFLLMQGARAPEHLYTKRPFMPEMFGKTGAMINQSLIVDVYKGEEWHKNVLGLSDAEYDQWLRDNAGFIPRGSLAKDNADYKEGSLELVPAWSVESFPVDEAMKNAHNKDFKGNVGNTVVAPSHKFILWALNNPDIHMILAYHGKGGSPIMKQLSGYDMATQMDDGYHTLGTDGKAIKDLSVNEIGLEISGGALQWNRLLRRNGYDAKKAAQTYLDYCKENGLTPMFNYEGVVDHPNYYKMLTDFRMYDEDGKSIRQKAVKATLPENWKEILNKYLEQEQSSSNKVSNVTLDPDVMREIEAATKFTSIEDNERTGTVSLLQKIYGKNNVEVLSQKDFDSALDRDAEEGRAQMLRDSGGTVYGYAKGEKMVLNDNLFNANTPLHEHTHIYMKVLATFNPKLYERGMELWKDTPLWNEAKSDIESLGEEPTDERVFSECMSQFTGSENEKIIAEVTGVTDKNWIKKAMEWLKDMWEGVKSAFKRWTKSDLDSLTAEQFAHMPLRSFYDETERKEYVKKLREMEKAGGFDENSEGYEGSADIRFSIVRDPKEIERLNSGETFPMYSAMQTIDDGLYSPMAAVIGGKRTDPVKMGEWHKADEHPELVNDDGTFTLVKTDKKKGAGEGDVPAAYNPYMHVSSSMMNDQFTGAYARGNIRVIEWRIPKSELTSGYHADKAKDSVGMLPWHSGTVNGLLPRNKQRKVMLSRWRQAVRYVPDSEVAERVAKQIEGTDLALPFNIFTPNQIRELAKIGAPISTVEAGTVGKETKEKFLQQKAELEKEFPQAQFVDKKMTQDAYLKWGTNEEVKNDIKQRKKEAARKRAEAKKAKVKASLGLNPAEQSADMTGDNGRRVTDSVVNTANQLGGAEANVYTSVDDVPEEYHSEVEQGAKGWYDPETHTVHVYLPNCADGNEAQRTVFHEKIGHEGMEVLLGGEQGVRKFANFVYRTVGKETRGKILDFANKYDPDWQNHDRINVGTQEYIAHLAEEGPATAEDFSLWTKIKHYLIEALKKLGIRIPGLLNDKDLRYYLMKAGKALHVWDNMPKEKQEAMMQQASNANIKEALGEGAGKGKPRQKKGESAIQYMKRVMEWKRWKEAREDVNDPEPPQFYDFDKDVEGKKEWEQLNKKWRDEHGLKGDEMPIRPERKEGESDADFMSRYKDWEAWNNAIVDKDNPMPDMFSFEKERQQKASKKYEDWLARHELLEQEQADLDLYEGKIYPAETNPEADALEQRVMQDLAEVTSTDVSKEGAARTVKYAVIHRRKNMEEASADDAIYINDVKNRIEKMADSGAFDKLLSDYQGKPNKAEKLAEAIPYIIEAPRRLRDIAYDLNNTGAFDKGHIHIQPDDVEAIQPFVDDLARETSKKHIVVNKKGEEEEVYDDPKAVSEVASKMAQAINENHQGEEGFAPIDGTDILGESVLPLVKQKVVPEGIDYKNLSPEMQSTIDSIRDWYNYTYDWLKDNHTLREDTGFNNDYVNHLWDKEKSDKQAYATFVENRQRTKSPNEKPRTISTLMEGISVGLVPKTTDITKMMAYYSRSNIEAYVNKTMLQELSGLNVIERNDEGEIISTDPLLSSTAPFNLEQYRYFEIPGVGPVWVYNVSPNQVKVKNPITGKEKVLYSEASAGDRFGVVFDTYQSSPFWKAFDTLASSAKKLELGFSGFHAGALTEVYMVQNMVEFGPKKALANFMKYIFADTAKNHQLPCFANPEDFQEAATHLVKFGATNDYAAADVQSMFDNFRDAMMKVQEKLAKGNVASKVGATVSLPFKVASQMLSLINKGMDRALWDFLHDGLKLASYRMRAEKTKARAEKNGWTDEQLSKALDEDGQFVNDMFGGQHWDVLGASHRTLRYAGRVLLSPDWNTSTTRHFLALTGYGSVWNEATFENFKQYYKNLWGAAKGKNELSPDDWGRTTRQLSSLLCYGLGFMVFYEGIANGINAAFRALDEEKERKKAEEMRKTNSNYRSPCELAYPNGMQWYDYLMRGNSLGQQSKIFLGRYADGTEMYIRHGKQFREVPEYLFNHKGELEVPGPMVQRMIGKANPMVRMTLDDINYLSDFQASHADQEIQRKYGKTIGLLYKDALYWAPFLIPSQENKEFKVVDFFFPSSKGFSPWKAQSYFKDFILSGDMEGIAMTYQSCERNGIDPEAQIKAAIGSVKALETAEMKDGVTSLQIASQRFDEAKSITEKKKMRQKMKKFLSQSEYKAFTQKEALDMVQSYLNGEDDIKELEKADSKYLMKAKSEDVTEDWRIQAVWNGTMETYQEYLRLKDADKAKARAFKNSKTNKRLFEARKAISAAKKKMNKAKKEMNGQNDAAKLVEIRKTRTDLLKALDKMK